MNKSTLKLDWNHQLATGVRVSPSTISYIISLTDLLCNINSFLGETIGIEVELHADKGTNNELALFLDTPYRAVEKDGQINSLFELIRDYYENIDFAIEFAIDIIANLYGISRLHVETVNLTPDKTAVNISLTTRPKERYFIIIHPSNGHFQRVFRHRANDLRENVIIELWDDKQEPVEVWRHDSLEVPKRVYDFLMKHSGKSFYKEHAANIINSYLKGRDYKYFMNNNPSSEQYQYIYVAPPLQKLKKGYEVVDEMNGELINLNYDSVDRDYTEISEGEYVGILALLKLGQGSLASLN
ncbi:hypothetical protein IAQ67_14635 [Paenibacillus peoriae]|uniref:Uncharacterized protein n=1 Tax=Paenibacillus peoriae TaxID=59893 RepID=A0A7H0Y243_9BACL|nr:hypothetical protein [Paenibacillus peoriae]QNR65151.1 hypothetical protein IAQ67_14635 [Paenibacillus peoriae]